jgi:hypothetical protein
MVAAYLLSECLENVFLNLLDENPSGNTRIYTSTKDLYSCSLVSRNWCKISTPFLYAYPFHHFRHLAYSNIYYNFSNVNYSSYFKLIRTLLSCIPKSEIEQIISSNSSNEQNLSLNLIDSNENAFFNNNISTTFNYIKFIRGLIFDKILSKTYRLFQYREIWFSPYISNDITKEQFSKISNLIMNYFTKSLCTNCNNLTTLEFPFKIQDNEFFSDIIESLNFSDYNRKNKLSNLKELYYINNKYGEICSSPDDLYSVLSNKICNLNLLYNDKINSIEEANSLSQFISLQKNLKHIILSENIYNLEQIFNNDIIINDNYNIIFESLSTQSESLQILEFNHIPFNRISEKGLNSLYLLKNIRELKLCKCKEINDNLNSWAKSLTKLEVLEFGTYYFPTNSEGFLVQLIKSSNALYKLVLDYKRDQDQGFKLLKQIPIYLHSLIYLELPQIFLSELIPIFKSCTRLVYLSMILSGDELWEGNFSNLGKFIPKTLRQIQLKGIDNLVFSSNELKCFFKECVNNDSNLRYLEIIKNWDDVINQEYFDVAKEFGVKLIRV